MKKIVYDCDLTLGVPGCDVDDGLALMYLLGCPEAELLLSLIHISEPTRPY